MQIVEDDHDVVDLHITSGADLVSAIHFSPSNSYASFVIFPDGSKEGWNTSDKGDDRCVKHVKIIVGVLH